MVKIFKDWYLTIGKDGKSYDLLQAQKLSDGKPVDGRIVEEGFQTAADAVNFVLESEARKRIGEQRLLELAEFIAIYGEISDEILDELKSLPANLRIKGLKYDPLHGVETR